MKQFFNSRVVKQMLPYLLLIIGAIIAWNVISQFGTFTRWVGVAWGIVTPFFYGFILAYILNMPCSAINKLLNKIKWKFMGKISRALSIVITYLLFVAVFVVALWLIIPRVSASLDMFIRELPQYYEGALEFLDDFTALEFLGIYINPRPECLTTYPYTMLYNDEGIPICCGIYPDGLVTLTTADIEAWVQDITQYIVQNLNFDNILSGITTAFGSAFSVAFSTVLAFISSVFFLIEKERISAFIARILSAFLSLGVSNVILKYTRQLNFNFKQYIYTQTIDGIILGTLATLVLAFIIQSPYALILGLMLGIINYIPYFGSIFGSLVSIVVVAFTQGLGPAALAAVILLVLQQIDGNVIQPKLMGSSFKISPLLIIVSVTVGGAIAGILGMLAAIPIVAVLRDILLNVINYFETKHAKKYQEASD